MPVQLPKNETRDSVLEPEDDPKKMCSNLPSNWAVTSHLQIGRKLSDGSTTKCSPLLISVGDFVDVGLEVDVATGGRHNRNRVHFSITHVLQLLKATDVATVRHHFLFFSSALICKRNLYTQLDSSHDKYRSNAHHEASRPTHGHAHRHELRRKCLT